MTEQTSDDRDDFDPVGAEDQAENMDAEGAAVQPGEDSEGVATGDDDS